MVWKNSVCFGGPCMIIFKSMDANEPSVNVWKWPIFEKRPQKLGFLAITPWKINRFEKFQLICDPGTMYILEYFFKSFQNSASIGLNYHRTRKIKSCVSCILFEVKNGNILIHMGNQKYDKYQLLLFPIFKI